MTTHHTKLVRKIQLMGGSTYIVSLPKEWALQAGIRRGSLVTLSLEPDGTIKIIPSGKKTREVSSTTIKVTHDTTRGILIREIMSRYLAGYKMIKIEFEVDNYELRRTVREIITRKLIGAEILHEDIREVILQILVNIEELPINVIVKRMTNVASNMLKDGIYGLSNINEIDKDTFKDIVERDDLVDKLYLYGLRQLHATIKGYLNIEEAGLHRLEEVLPYGVVLKSIERVADHAAYIAYNCIEMFEPLRSVKDVKGITDFANTIIKFFEDSINTFLEKDKINAHKLMDSIPIATREREKKLAQQLPRLSAKTAIPLRLILSSYRRISDYSADILEATLDLAAE